MLSKTCSDFIDQLGSTAAVPGGGSASALVGAIGAALGTMAGVLTTGKKSAAEHEDELAVLISESRSLTEKFKAAVNRDVTAFEPLSEAYKMPNKTEEEKAARQAAIQAGLPKATDAPMDLAEICVEALDVLNRYSLIANRLVISDVGVGAAMCEAALRGARLNVLINLRSIKDEKIKGEYEDRLEAACKKGEELSLEAYARVEEACR